MKHHHKHSFRSSLVMGSGLIVLGVLFLLPMLGVQDFDITWRWWPVIIMVMGVAEAVDAPNLKKIGEGIWTLFIGFWLLVSSINLWGLNYGTSWPLLLIGVGIGTMWKAILRKHPSYRGTPWRRGEDDVMGEEEVRHEA